MSDIMQSLQCTHCGGAPLTDNGDGTLSCPYCGASFAHPERLCPYCQTINDPDARHCVSCGEKLRESCPRCGALNGVQAPHCHQCGAALDLLEHIATRQAETVANRIVRIQSEMPLLKDEAERGSQARLEKMWARDHERMEAMAKSKVQQERQERLLWTIAAAAIVLCIVGIVALTLFTQLRAH
jgi:ribosomal protein L40E